MWSYTMKSILVSEAARDAQSRMGAQADRAYKQGAWQARKAWHQGGVDPLHPGILRFRRYRGCAESRSVIELLSVVCCAGNGSHPEHASFCHRQVRGRREGSQMSRAHLIK